MHMHVAIFKWKDGASRSRIESAFEELRQVVHRVDGLTAIYCGPNTSEWSQGFTDAVVVLAKSAEAIHGYLTDELHDHAAAIIDELKSDGLGIDFSDG